jgi:hypothetical protein
MMMNRRVFSTALLAGGTKVRMAFLDRAAADKTLVGSYHLPFPGFGHVVCEGSAYRWLPADWQWTTAPQRCVAKTLPTQPLR